MNSEEIGWKVVSWDRVVQDSDKQLAVVNAVTNLWVP
jgi:hypothetical protein